MARLYIIAFRWAKNEPNVTDLERDIAPLGSDWIRLNVHVWLLWSDLSTQALQNVLNTKLRHPENSVLILPAEHRDFGGFAPKILWEWLKRR